MQVTQSYAYVDPGTGTFILQTIIALISGLFFYLTNPKLLLRKIKIKIISILLYFKKTKKKEKVTSETNEKN